MPHRACDESNAIMAAGNRRYETHKYVHPVGEKYNVFHLTLPHLLDVIIMITILNHDQTRLSEVFSYIQYIQYWM